MTKTAKTHNFSREPGYGFFHKGIGGKLKCTRCGAFYFVNATGEPTGPARLRIGARPAEIKRFEDCTK